MKKNLQLIVTIGNLREVNEFISTKKLQENMNFLGVNSESYCQLKLKLKLKGTYGRE